MAQVPTSSERRDRERRGEQQALQNNRARRWHLGEELQRIQPGACAPASMAAVPIRAPK